MNDRIKELAELAIELAYGVTDEIDPPAPANLSEKYDEIFAKLVVTDAISVLQKRFMGDLNREDMEVRRCIEDVKKHFGIEE